MNTPNVRNMINSRGNAVRNQFIVTVDGKGTFFQSYRTVIAGKTPEGIVLDRDSWDYSVTTGKYRNQCLRETKKETEAKIKSGEYKLVDLNS